MKYEDIRLIDDAQLMALSFTSMQKQAIEHMVETYGSPLLLLDCQVLREQYRLLRAALPNVTLHFALKPLPHEAVVSTLFNEGAHFDLASNGEVDLVRRQNISADKCIHTHPIKRLSDIQYALDFGCHHFVIDGINELRKFVAFKDQVELFLRLSFPNKDVFADLSKKFGCNIDAAFSILKEANDLGICVNGLSFHVGSQTQDAQRYVYAIERSQALIKSIQQSELPNITKLDIGGGFPVTIDHLDFSIHEFCTSIRGALDQLDPSIALMAEPGRFIVAPAVMNVSSVMGQAMRAGKPWYYLDDGVYGSFSGILFDQGHYPIDALNPIGPRFESVLAGPTCDSIDVIDENIMLPKLHDGDLIVTPMMGAYTSATATDFNFFKKANIIALNL